MLKQLIIQSTLNYFGFVSFVLVTVHTTSRHQLYSTIKNCTKQQLIVDL